MNVKGKLKSGQASTMPEYAPFWYACGGILATPLLAVFLLLSAVSLVILWPFVPITLYRGRKEDIQKLHHNGDTKTGV